MQFRITDILTDCLFLLTGVEQKTVSRLAERGPAPELIEREAPYVRDLDDGIMVNSSALWELVLPLWKDPKKWWVSLSDPKGKKDSDWPHKAMRYWPDRIMEKVKKDPLAVAHYDYGEFEGRDFLRNFIRKLPGSGMSCRGGRRWIESWILGENRDFYRKEDCYGIRW